MCNILNVVFNELNKWEDDDDEKQQNDRQQTEWLFSSINNYSLYILLKYFFRREYNCYKYFLQVWLHFVQR